MNTTYKNQERSSNILNFQASFVFNASFVEEYIHELFMKFLMKVPLSDQDEAVCIDAAVKCHAFNDPCVFVFW